MDTTTIITIQISIISIYLKIEEGIDIYKHSKQNRIEADMKLNKWQESLLDIKDVRKWS